MCLHSAVTIFPNLCKQLKQQSKNIQSIQWLSNDYPMELTNTKTSRTGNKIYNMGCYILIKYN